MSEEEKEIWKQFTASFVVPGGTNLQIPPPSFTELEGTLVVFVPNESLTVAFPVRSKYANPTGNLQGGILTAMFDNTFGPLSYALAKRPVTSLDLSVNFVRPVREPDAVTVIAKVVARGTSTMFLTAEAFNSKKKLIATASTQMLIMK